MEQVQDLLNNIWIEKCGGTWGRSIVLAEKIHQENIQNIDDFIWRMCVSYGKINGSTKPFKLKTPCCYDVISTIGAASNKIRIIILDTRQGYHQILVHHADREKIAFFAPDNKRYTSLVMLFETTNVPVFYPATMKNFKE